MDAVDLDEVGREGISRQCRNSGSLADVVIEIFGAQLQFGAIAYSAPKPETHPIRRRYATPIRHVADHGEFRLGIGHADGAVEPDIVDRGAAADTGAAEKIGLHLLRVVFEVPAAGIERTPGAVDLDAVDEASILPVVSGLRTADESVGFEIDGAKISEVVISPARQRLAPADMSAEIEAAPVGGGECDRGHGRWHYPPGGQVRCRRSQTLNAVAPAMSVTFVTNPPARMTPPLFL
jgi:hypothetical protein